MSPYIYIASTMELKRKTWASGLSSCKSSSASNGQMLLVSLCQDVHLHSSVHISPTLYYLGHTIIPFLCLFWYIFYDAFQYIEASFYIYQVEQDCPRTVCHILLELKETANLLMMQYSIQFFFCCQKWIDQLNCLKHRCSTSAIYNLSSY